MTSTSTIEVRGVELTVRSTDPADSDKPDRRAVIWGHGLTSSMDAEDEFALIDWSSAASGRRLVRYDARGHGRSESTAEPANYAWSELALDQLALADALGIGAYVAGGASMGAATALHAAVIAPERIVALLVVIPPTAWATRAAQVDRYGLVADLVIAGEHQRLLHGNAAIPPPDPVSTEPRWTERFSRLLRESDPERLARVYRGAATADLPPEDAIAAIDVPTLILAWTGDPGHPMTTAARLQELMPHAELAVATTPTGLAAWSERVVRWLQTIG